MSAVVAGISRLGPDDHTFFRGRARAVETARRRLRRTSKPQFRQAPTPSRPCPAVCSWRPSPRQRSMIPLRITLCAIVARRSVCGDRSTRRRYRPTGRVRSTRFCGSTREATASLSGATRARLLPRPGYRATAAHPTTFRRTANRTTGARPAEVAPHDARGDGPGRGTGEGRTGPSRASVLARNGRTADGPSTCTAGVE